MAWVEDVTHLPTEVAPFGFQANFSLRAFPTICFGAKTLKHGNAETRWWWCSCLSREAGASRPLRLNFLTLVSSYVRTCVGAWTQETPPTVSTSVRVTPGWQPCVRVSALWSRWPSQLLPWSPSSQHSLTRAEVLTAWGTWTYCCGLASGAFGASLGVWGHPAVTARTIGVPSLSSHPPSTSCLNAHVPSLNMAFGLTAIGWSHRDFFSTLTERDNPSVQN